MALQKPPKKGRSTDPKTVEDILPKIGAVPVRTQTSVRMLPDLKRDAQRYALDHDTTLTDLIEAGLLHVLGKTADDYR